MDEPSICGKGFRPAGNPSPAGTGACSMCIPNLAWDRQLRRAAGAIDAPRALAQNPGEFVETAHLQ